jgi:glycosyltransferase involved in cell wall biosynthesis
MSRMRHDKRRKPLLTIFFQFNPWRYEDIGGIQTLIRAQVKYAPRELELRVIGAGTDADRLGERRFTEFLGREIEFMPLVAQRQCPTRAGIPDTMRYALHLAGKSLASDFMHFHRIEPTFLTRWWPGVKTLFVHHAPKEQIGVDEARNESHWRRFPRVYLALERLLIGQFHEVLSCNTAALRFHRQRYPRIANRFRFMPNVVDTEIHYPLDVHARETQRLALAQRMRLPGATRFVLFAGRLERMKDPLLLLEAFRALDRPHTHLLMAGDGSMRNELRRRIEFSGVESKVTLLGALAPAKLAELQQVSAALVLTSAYEGMPMVMLEALASGTPVVSTPCGESANILRALTGIVTKDFQAHSVTQALRYILDDPQQYSVSKCVQAVQPFAAHVVIPQYFDDMLTRWHPARDDVPEQARMDTG